MRDQSTPQAGAILEELLALAIGEALGREQLERVAEIATTETYAAGSYVFCQGAEARALRVVLSGRISLALEVSGGDSVVVGALSRGDMLGWSALVGWHAPARWTASARASKTSRLLALPGDELRELCERDHELGFYLMRHAFEVVAHRLADCRLRLLDVYGGEHGR